MRQGYGRKVNQWVGSAGMGRGVQFPRGLLEMVNLNRDLDEVRECRADWVRESQAKGRACAKVQGGGW